MNIGLRIRSLRLKNKLTQQELAKNLEVTSGYISQIENNIISPSLQTLFNLLKIFKISISDFFSNKKNIELIYRNENFLKIKNKNFKNTITYLFPNLNGFKLEPLIIELESNGKTEIENVKIKNEDEFYFVLEGEIILVLGKGEYLVKKEETFYLSTDKPYYLINYNYQKAKILKIKKITNFK